MERMNTKLTSSVLEPVYVIPYLTAQARSGIMNVSASNLSLAVAGNIICRIQNNSTNLMTSVESILVNSSASLGYSIIRNATLSGSLTVRPVYNLNEKYPASTSTIISSAANATVSVSGGSTLLTQLSLTNVFNPIIVPIIIQPGSSLYFSSSGALGLNVTVNVIFCEYPVS
ncbi:hypothetical protein [Sporomusa aerivorans]|uniref:hypothetical protein n=1 Tax=Sporomusa aerivorans TaxID=204936 RepID=UPI00352BC3D6